MAIVLLALTDGTLRDACSRLLSGDGHIVIAVDRPLAVLGLARQLQWDLLCVDRSELGRRSAEVAAQVSAAPAVAISFASGDIAVLDPTNGGRLTDFLSRFPRKQPDTSRPALRLDPGGRRVLVGDTEVRLSLTEYRLLALLWQKAPQGVSNQEAFDALWGADTAAASEGALRVHVRNLRTKLAAVGLSNVIQSRRGRGYALVLASDNGE